jgi:hypothetical protein
MAVLVKELYYNHDFLLRKDLGLAFSGFTLEILENLIAVLPRELKRGALCTGQACFLFCNLQNMMGTISEICFEGPEL